MRRAADALVWVAGVLRAPQLLTLLAMTLALLTLAAQIPLNYLVNVGQEDGVGADLPLLRGVFPPEQVGGTRFRWTTDAASVRLPGVGVRPVQLRFQLLATNEEVAQRGPQTVALWANGAPLAELPVRRAGAVYRLMLPADSSGDQLVELRSTTFVPSGDERAIGVALSSVRAVAGPLGWPAWRSSGLWLLAGLLLWLALRAAGFAPNRALLLTLAPALALGAAAVLDPPRAAFGAQPFTVALALGLALVIGLRLGLRERQAGAAARPWLLLLVLAVFVLRYGGKIYPDSMPGDIGFHANRFADTLRGTVLLLSRNRGVDFPYPPGLYLVLAPLLVTGVDRRVLLQLGGALLDAVSVLLVFWLARATLSKSLVSTSPRRNEETKATKTNNSDPDVHASASERWALVAALVYGLSASGFMTTWWNFSTHIGAQFAHLLLVTVVVLLWTNVPRASAASGAPATAASVPRASAASAALATGGSVLVLLQSLVYLGHFGFWMNTTLLGGVALSAWLIVAVRRGGWGRFWWWAGAFVAAQLLAVALFYSGYTGLFATQIGAAASGGLTGLAGREAVPVDVLWATLLDAGLRVHFGFVPVLLALGGWALLTRETLRGTQRTTSAAPAATLLAWGTVLIAMVFAALPFLTGSTLSSRWLMFSAWVVAVGTAITGERLWRRGWLGRAVVIGALGYMLWITAAQYIGALAFRIRPPEPF